MRAIAMPSAPVMPVKGRAFTLVDGTRHIEYADAGGNRYLCATDGVARSWYALDGENKCAAKCAICQEALQPDADLCGVCGFEI